MNAYSELYLDDAMQNLGDMVDYAVCDLGFDPDEFFGWFISSGIASRFEKGNPKYVGGMSGYELADAVLTATNVSYEKKEPSYSDFKGREYWAGWILAYYQWITNKFTFLEKFVSVACHRSHWRTAKVFQSGNFVTPIRS